jgi:hypothetical protein
MVRFKRMVPVATLLLAGSFAAHADTTTTYAFTSVTKVAYGQNSPPSISITGVLADTAAPATFTIPSSSSAALVNQCVGFFFPMISAPGTYTLTLITTTSNLPYPDGSPGTVTVTVLTNCSLDRNP